MSKLFILISTFVYVCTFSLEAQTDKQFKKLIAELDTAKSISSLELAEQNFEKLIVEEKRLKQSLYFAALANLFIAFEADINDVDDYCRKADFQLKKLDSLSPSNSEIHVLLAMSAAAKIRVDPASRNIKFGPLANKYADRAISLNGNNPRAYLMKAKTVLNAPPKLGGGPKFAIKHYEKAIEKYKAFKPLSDLEPNWGLAIAKKELEECKTKVNQK